MKKVSVIVPVYNTEKYLKKCLDSLVNQTLQDIEIIIVNDGSKDNSQKIIDDYLSKYSQIRNFQKENGGLSDARNFGIDRAEGDYIGFVDSDDFVDKQMFEKMYLLSQKHNAEMVICDLEKVNENGTSFRKMTQSPQLPEKMSLKDDCTFFGEMECFACNKIFKKELFENHRFKKGIHFEDIELIPQLILKSKVLAKINEPFYKYFERQDSITKTHTKKGLDIYIAIDNVKDSFSESNYSNFENEMRRFVIFQGFYCYLAYVAYVKDKQLKSEMLDVLWNKMNEFDIKKTEILFYKRFNKNYLFSLPFKKKVFYLLALINKKLIAVL
ncbi:glycosyltransferase family 2 protein [Moheibacter sediminis]|uniref:Glycosyltransferase involved in cell wall bisynthesis n=1 Tax=Moheibacter sediminis TaxID=1434700 RepID=A0A1W2ALC2_9FLAO|nr:glycosyltransferase [Moheibacter sediminis]SMC61463.1 Glycosyltransferase involved in cell wall bisynthesis [Moheibacter sediminis]